MRRRTPDRTFGGLSSADISRVGSIASEARGPIAAIPSACFVPPRWPRWLTTQNIMNGIELQNAIQARLRTVEKSRSLSEKERTPWILPMALAGSGAACLAAAASIPALATPHILTGLAAASGGALGLTAGLKIGGIGIAILGTAFPIPAWVMGTLTASGGMVAAGSGAYLEFLNHASVSLWAIGFHWVGLVLLIGAAAYAGVLWLRNSYGLMTIPCAV